MKSASERRKPASVRRTRPAAPRGARAPATRRGVRGSRAGLESRSAPRASRGHAVAQPEAQDQALGQALARRQRLVGPDGKLPALDEGAVALDRLDVAVAHVAEEAGGARAEAEVLLGAPVDLVVGRAPSRAGVVGDLVVLEAGLRGQPREPRVLRGDSSSPGGSPVHAGRVPEAALVEGERVGGEVIGLPAR